MFNFGNSFSQGGQIQLILGPMFSGKTTELIRRIKRYETANHNCLVIKYAKDVRYEAGDLISTHDRSSYSAIKTTSLNDLKLLNNFKETDISVIGIDEGQFFSDVVEFSEEMANMGKIVIVAALDGTYQRKGFGEILNLIPLAENIVKLNAVCMSCYKDAPFSKRIVTDTQIELIGGKESYLAVCRNCYFGQNSKKNMCNNIPTSQSKQFSDLSNIENVNHLHSISSPTKATRELVHF